MKTLSLQELKQASLFYTSVSKLRFSQANSSAHAITISYALSLLHGVTHSKLFFIFILSLSFLYLRYLVVTGVSHECYAQNGQISSSNFESFLGQYKPHFILIKRYSFHLHTQLHPPP